MFRQLLPRLLFVVFAVIFAVYTYVLSVDKNPDFSDLLLYIIISMAFSGGLVVWERFYLKNLAREMVALMFGTTAGLFASGLFLVIAGLFLVPYNIINAPGTGNVGDAILRALWQVQFLSPLVLAACLYLGVTIVLQTRNDFRFLLPYIDFSQRGTQEGGMLLDTSALIDGRILDISRAGIITAPLIIPDYVLREMQALADGKDRLKRERGRRGLDIATELQKMEGVKVTVRTSEGVTAGGEVDVLLVRDAKTLNGRLITTDFNLNKLGKAEGVPVLNINDLCGALKPQYIPGDHLNLRIIRKGQEAGQGVGYLDDGTMVVVDNGEKMIGETARVDITGSIQTSAGRMIFGTAGAAERNEHGN